MDQIFPNFQLIGQLLTSNLETFDLILKLFRFNSLVIKQALKGARLKRIEKYVNADQMMVTYGDGVADIDIEKLFKFHISHGKTATVTGVRPKFLRFGELDINKDQVARFAEKPKYTGNYVNGGFFVFNRALFDYLDDRDDCDLEVGPLDQISQEGELMVYKHDNFWACMDTIRDAEHLNNLWNNKQQSGRFGRAG